MKICCGQLQEALAENIIHDWSFRKDSRYVISSEDDAAMDVVYCPFCGKKLEQDNEDQQ